MKGKNESEKIKSIDFGNIPSKALVNLGKEFLESSSSNGYVDYGDLPARMLPEIGKQVLASQVLKNDK